MRCGRPYVRGLDGGLQPRWGFDQGHEGPHPLYWSVKNQDC